MGIRTAVLVSSLCLWGSVAQATELNGELEKQAEKVLQYAREKGYKSVGVLKFRVQDGERKPKTTAGALNQSLARRMEIALVMRNDVKNEVGVVGNASAVAAAIDGAGYDEKSRTALFVKKYLPLWGKQEEVTPDAFITGAVQPDDDLKTMTVTLSCFDKDGKEHAFPPFKVDTSADLLTGLGRSFLMGNTFKKPAEAASEAKKTPEAHPLMRADRPLDVKIFYQTERSRAEAVKLNIDRKGVGWEAWVEEPKKDQEVSFVLSRREAAGKDRFAVVLKVNGENSLYRERLPNVRCAKWVLEDGDQMPPVRGFQKRNKPKADTFVMKELDEPNPFGEHLGTINLVVYKEKSKDRPLPKVTAPEVAREIKLDQAPMYLGSLKEKLRQKAGEGSALLGPAIQRGPDVDSPIREVPFDLDPEEVMSVTIHYLRRSP